MFNVTSTSSFFDWKFLSFVSHFFCPFILFLFLCTCFFGFFHPFISASFALSLSRFKSSLCLFYLFAFLNHFLFCPSFTFMTLLLSLNFHFLLLSVVFTFSCFFLNCAASFLPSLTPSQLWPFLSSPLIVMSLTFLLQSDLMWPLYVPSNFNSRKNRLRTHLVTLETPGRPSENRLIFLHFGKVYFSPDIQGFTLTPEQIYPPNPLPPISFNRSGSSQGTARSPGPSLTVGRG